MKPPFHLPRRTPPPLPWRRPRYELALLALVAVAALTPVYAVGAQDASRVCLARSLAHFQLNIDSCLGSWKRVAFVDQSSYGGHLYSDKAPGMSVLELPTVAAIRVPSAPTWPIESLRIWLVRVLSSGIAFVLCAFLVGRISEGLAPGYGGVSLVAFGLGTLFAPLAVANFEHITVGLLGLMAFALAWRARPVTAGLAGGAALTVGYEAALIVLILGAYLALQGGKALLRFAAGVLPGAVLLGAYDWAAFGAPWHFSYRYIVGSNAENQAAGFFGIHRPYLHAIREVFVGSGGLLVTSPVVLAAGLGLVLLGRRCRPEAVVCAAVAAAFAILNCGYFLPYGGISPGPRFLAPCLPFLALGLGPAFAARFSLTALLTAASVVATTGLTLTWVNLSPDPGTIWKQLVHLPVDSSQIVRNLSSNVVVWMDASRTTGAVLVALAAAAALTLSVAGADRRAAQPVGDTTPAA